MLKIGKFVLGIRPAQKMFRVGSLSGMLIDTILEARSDKILGEKYFTEVAKSADQGVCQLSNIDQGNILRIDENNVVFTRDVYSNEKHVSIEKLLGEWRLLWKCLNGTLPVRDIRRIGIAAEHQFEVTDGTASSKLFGGLLVGTRPLHPGKLLLQYEDRRPMTGKSGLPDIAKDAFINVIHHFYDSELDTDHPNPRHINANLDVQKYFSPLYNGNLFDEVAPLYKLFQKEQTALDDHIKERGLI